MHLAGTLDPSGTLFSRPRASVREASRQRGGSSGAAAAYAAVCTPGDAMRPLPLSTAGGETRARCGARYGVVGRQRDAGEGERANVSSERHFVDDATAQTGVTPADPRDLQQPSVEVGVELRRDRPCRGSAREPRRRPAHRGMDQARSACIATRRDRRRRACRRESASCQSR